MRREGAMSRIPIHRKKIVGWIEVKFYIPAELEERLKAVVQRMMAHWRSL